MLAKFFFSWFLNWLPVVFSGVVLLLMIINYFLADRKYLKFLKVLTTTKLIYILIGCTLFFDILLSVLQYFVWRESAFSRFFLPPFQSITYFLRYSLFHFFAANILALVLALVFYSFLRLIKKYRANIISREELSLLFLAVLLVSWPKAVLFIPIFLLLTVIFSVVNLLVFKREQVDLVLPIFLSLVIAFIFGSYLIEFLSLSYLII